MALENHVLECLDVQVRRLLRECVQDPELTDRQKHGVGAGHDAAKDLSARAPSSAAPVKFDLVFEPSLSHVEHKRTRTACVSRPLVIEILYRATGLDDDAICVAGNLRILEAGEAEGDPKTVRLRVELSASWCDQARSAYVLVSGLGSEPPDRTFDILRPDSTGLRPVIAQ